MTHSLKEHFVNLFKFGLAIGALVFIVFMLTYLAIHNWFTRRQKNTPMDAYPHL